MHRTVLITGAYGFIGRHVARRFGEMGLRVIGVGRGAWPEREWRALGISEWHPCEISLESLLTYGGQPQAVIHCAGSGSVPFSMTHPAQDFRRTVLTTLDVLEFVRQQAPQARVVYPSSAAVYGQAKLLPISEDHPLNPISPYGVHKKIAEELICSYGRHFGVAGVLIRLFSVYGEGLRKQLLWDACNKMRDGDTEFFGTGDEIRDWIHVDDVAELVTRAIEHASPDCPAVNGASGLGVRVSDILSGIAAEFPKTQRIVFPGHGRPGDPEKYVADISLVRQWGWQPKITWPEGIKRYVAWFKEDSP